MIRAILALLIHTVTPQWSEVVSVSEGTIDGKRWIKLDVLVPTRCASVLFRRGEGDLPLRDWTDRQKMIWIENQLRHLCEVNQNRDRCGCEAEERIRKGTW